MKNQVLVKSLYVSPVKERNEEKYGTLSTPQCICCMKPIKEENPLYVHMNTDWMAVNPEIVTEANCAELTGADSQGCFEIGNDCAKKMKGYTFKLSN